MHPTSVFTAPMFPWSSWSGLYLHPFVFQQGGCPPSSLYTFPPYTSGGLGSVLPFRVSPTLTGYHLSVSGQVAQNSSLTSYLAALPRNKFVHGLYGLPHYCQANPNNWANLKLTNPIGHDKK